MKKMLKEEEYLEKVKRYHEKDAKEYINNRYNTENITQLGYVIRREIASEMLKMSNGKILDVGSGPGTFISTMQNRERKIFASDLSFEMVKEARRNNSGTLMHCTVGNLTNLGFRADIFDIVLCIGVMGYIPDPNRALTEIHRVLRPGGEAVLQTSNSGSIKEKIYEKWLPVLKKKIGIAKACGWGFDFPLYSYRKKDFDKMIESNGFKIEDWSFYDFHMPFFERLSMNATIKLAKWLQRYGKKGASRFLGSGYLVKVRKSY